MDPETQTLKKRVQEFYNRHGWRSLDDGSLVDSKLFVDPREVSRAYHARERSRDREYLPAKGRFFLDGASGALPYTDYSRDCDYHVCVDFSIAGLQEARRRSGLGARGLYVNADICHLPFKAGIFEAILSAHTLYHVPRRGQVEAVAELMRVLSAKGTLLALYSNIQSVSFRVKRFWEHLTRRPVTLQRIANVPNVFSEPLPRKKLEEIIQSAGGKPKFRCHSFMSRQMLQKLVPNNFIGRFMLRLVYRFETGWSSLAMPLGQYFSIQVRKNDINSKTHVHGNSA